MIGVGIRLDAAPLAILGVKNFKAHVFKQLLDKIQSHKFVELRIDVINGGNPVLVEIFFIAAEVLGDNASLFIVAQGCLHFDVAGNRYHVTSVAEVRAVASVVEIFEEKIEIEPFFVAFLPFFIVPDKAVAVLAAVIDENITQQIGGIVLDGKDIRLAEAAAQSGIHFQQFVHRFGIACHHHAESVLLGVGHGGYQFVYGFL